MRKLLVHKQWDSPLGENEPEEKKQARYSNFFKIGQNAVEFLLEFGQFFPGKGIPNFHTRLIINPTYTKELLMMLQESIHEYEAQYGKIPHDEN